jgi:hypothetical protein
MSYKITPVPNQKLQDPRYKWTLLEIKKYSASKRYLSIDKYILYDHDSIKLFQNQKYYLFVF